MDEQSVLRVVCTGPKGEMGIPGLMGSRSQIIEFIQVVDTFVVLHLLCQGTNIFLVACYATLHPALSVGRLVGLDICYLSRGQTIVIWQEDRQLLSVKMTDNRYLTRGQTIVI